MKTKGSGYLKLGGFLEVLLGIATIALTLWLLSTDPSDSSALGGINVADALWSLVWIYVCSSIQIIVGIVGIIFAKNTRKANLCKILGTILMICHFVSIGTGNIDGGAGLQISQYITLIAPSIYIYGAILNAKDRMY